MSDSDWMVDILTDIRAYTIACKMEEVIPLVGATIEAIQRRMINAAADQPRPPANILQLDLHRGGAQIDDRS